MTANLEEYGRKRNFGQTPEPSPQTGENRGPLTFVVQKHQARQLHYDFRLEVGGVLKSWSVPKGPSLDPESKHLAVMVEDHPLDYAAFEGVIPRGEYGAGEVIVWDNGNYSPDEGGKFLFDDRVAAEAQIRQGLEKGKISFYLRGHKLKGSWTLVKIRNKEKDWLLMKHNDEYASQGSNILKEVRSVLSNRTIEDMRDNLAAGEPPFPLLNIKEVPGARPASSPSIISPMLAGVASAPFFNPDWIFEPKLDGYRTISHIRNGDVTLLSRNGMNVTKKYSMLLPELSRQPVSDLVIDGEIIVMDEKGRQCFQCLQQYLNSVGRTQGEEAAQIPLIYYVFDILYLDGYDLRGATLKYRKGLLNGVLRPADHVKLMDYFEDQGETLFKAAIDTGLEGIIAKQINSVYESGRRSDSWLKIKSMLTDEFIIGGYSTAKGGREQTFSSLLLGHYDDRGNLVFAGHVGTGFDEKMLVELKSRLDSIRTDKNPFSEVPDLNAPTTWVRPELVAEVRYSEMTREGRLRIPVFIRLRDDKSPDEVRRAEQVTTPASSEEPIKDNPGDVIQQLQNPKDTFEIDIQGNKIRISNIDKVLWPSSDGHPAVTKRDFLIYLATVSPYILPHLKDRPLTMSRYPDGISGEHFYQKHWDHPIPNFVQKVSIREEKGSAREYLVCSNLSTLLWLGQLTNIEFHTWFSRIDTQPDMEKKKKDIDYVLDYPDFIVFDLDPYIYSGKEPSGAEPELNREGFARTAQVALWLKEILGELSLNAYLKTSGKTGLHVYVPITRDVNYKGVRSAAETIGRFLLQRHPAEVTMEWATQKRKGKVFLDYGQNVRGKTIASVYSPRPAPGATVSTPLSWEELGKVYPTDFSLSTMPDRLKKIGDLWADILQAKKDMVKLLETK